MKQTFRIRIPAQRKWDREADVFVDVKPEYWARVEVDINVEAIATELGRKAAASRGKRAAFGSGKVKVKFLGAVS